MHVSWCKNLRLFHNRGNLITDVLDNAHDNGVSVYAMHCLCVTEKELDHYCSTTFVTEIIRFCDKHLYV